MSCSGTPSDSGLHVVRVGHDAAREGVARARDVRQARRDQAARARLRGRETQPALAAEREHDLGDRPLVLAEEVALERLAHGDGEHVRALLCAGLHDEVDVDLEVAGADRRLHAVAVAACLGQRPRDGGLARTEEAEDAPAGRRRPREDALHGVARDGRRPEPLQLARRPREHDEDARAVVEHETRRGPGDPDHDRALGNGGLLRDARREVGVGPVEPLGHRAGDALDVAHELVVDPQRGAGDAGDELDRAVVVGRPETARDEADVGAGARGAQSRLELDGVVAHDRDLTGHEPEPERLARVERPVPIRPLAADELAAGDDDRRPRAAHTHSVVVLVTFRAQPRGSTTCRPLSLTTTLAGRSTAR